ncbi:MAG: DUF4198 domain-containing protein [Deltaproteobacteria bacterium]|jgi:cobalt/nickel transport protein|nr:DUF4198 domain-containing protein [Deltaproteobacteria bacterium]
MRKVWMFTLFLMLGLNGAAYAHFGMVIPSSSMVMDAKKAAISVALSFSHPMVMEGMPLVKPKGFKVFSGGKAEDLLPVLKSAKEMGHDAWKAEYKIQRPGVYQFVMEPQPYWEETEDCFIIHYTKTYVAAFGEEEGWDAPLGLKTEIVPLTRPFGNYAGNVFQGRVLLNGAPVPGAEVEVEFYNRNKKYAAPNDYMVTQVIKADDNGIFAYTVPFAGWWGFAALNTADERLEHKGAAKDVELGAVLWLEFLAPTMKK